ncbi:hypothetical protein ANN_22965 [Periplaneta americana]|uniref:Uncharacterized protein n=1 Tax=Periplaneta americana TaxID=6978 RepID=A0ABQ8SKK9_PERAM|nr:hypothetical protein ANN_22965 [Periplaneta americana]
MVCGRARANDRSGGRCWLNEASNRLQGLDHFYLNNTLPSTTSTLPLSGLELMLPAIHYGTDRLRPHMRQVTPQIPGTDHSLLKKTEVSYDKDNLRSQKESRNGKEAFNRKRSIFCGPLEKTKEETSELLCVECSIVWILRRSEEKRLEAFEMWKWRRMECTGKQESNQVVRDQENYGEEQTIIIVPGKKILLHNCAMSSLLSKNLKVRIYKTVILPVVLYGCETWTLTLREEQRLRVFENKVLRKIFGAKSDEVTGDWRKLHNAELHALYSSPDIIRNIKSRRLRWAGHVARMGESRNAYRVLVGRSEGKRPLGRPRRRWEDNIKMDLREVRYDSRDWINVAQDRDQWWAYVRAAMNLRVP